MRWFVVIITFLIALVVAGYFFPREVSLERTVTIDAPPEKIFNYLNNMRNFNTWSPWYSIDPSTKYEYSGAQEGLGARMSWTSEDPNVGMGKQTIIASEPDSLIRTHLDFGTQGMAMAEWRLEPVGDVTEVTWAFSTDVGEGPLARWTGLFVKKMVGDSYQQGLDKLKKLIESDPANKQPVEPQPE